MKICAKEARRLKSKIEFRRLMEKMKKLVFGLPGAVRSLRIFEEVVVDLVRRICKVGKGAQVENLLFYWFFCASVDVGRFLYLNNTPQAWDPPSFRGFFGLIFTTKRILSKHFCCSKKQRDINPFRQ